MALTLGEIASRLGLETQGDPETELHGVGTLQSGGPGELGFLANPRYAPHLASTGLAAVVVTAEDAGSATVPVLISSNPYADYARAAALLMPSGDLTPGVHPAAWVDPEAVVDAGAQVDAGALVMAGARIADGCYVGPACVIGREARLGRDCRLSASVTLCRGARLGERVRVHPGVVIGGDGFGIALDGGSWVKVPQLGGVVIGDDCEIGANTTIDRGAIEDTVLEEGVQLDNQIQVAHNVRIGAHTAIAGCTAVAGSTRIGRRCMIAGGVGIAGHLEIADDVVITAMTLVSSSIAEAGTYSGSMPMDHAVSWRRNSVRIRQLDRLARRVTRLERGAGQADDDRGEDDD